LKTFEWLFKDKKISKIEITLPALSVGEVLIKVVKVGICGSDLFALESVDQYEELRLGHEWVGEVENSLSDNYKVGDLVTSSAFIGCGECSLCLVEKSNFCQNGFALGGKDFGMLRSKAILPANQLLKVDNFSLNEIVLLEVAAVAEEAVSQILRLGLEKRHRVLVFGGGPVGLLTSLKLKEEGYDYTLIEKDNFRIKMARDLEVNIQALGMALLDDKKKFDYIIDASGNGNKQSGFWKYAKVFISTSSVCLIVGKYIGTSEIHSNLFAMNNLTIKWMRGMPKETLARTRDFWIDKFSHISSKMITHEFNFSDVSKAFDLALARDNCMKIIINVNVND